MRHQPSLHEHALGQRNSANGAWLSSAMLPTQLPTWRQFLAAQAHAILAVDAYVRAHRGGNGPAWMFAQRGE